MPPDEPVLLRAADAGDAEGVALLHADSWRRHYRGVYSDAFLDGDVASDRLAVWSARLAAPAGSETVVAEQGGQLVGFVHVVFGADPRWGSLIDNLHVGRHLRGNLHSGATRRRPGTPDRHPAQAADGLAHRRHRLHADVVNRRRGRCSPIPFSLKRDRARTSAGGR